MEPEKRVYLTMKRSNVPERWVLSKEGMKVCDRILTALHDGMKKSRYEKPTVVLYQFLETSGYLAYLADEEEAGNR